jgi:general secretion pathway protein A
VYETFFGLTERPFELTPNPKYLYLTAQHQEALSALVYGITSARGITLLLGEAGTGKTTLIRAALEATSRTNNVASVCLVNPTLSRPEFVQFLADEFGLSSDAAGSKTMLMKELREALAARKAAGSRTILVIDEAQSLPYELLEEVRLLANLETNDEKLLPLVLAGQPELAARLDEPKLRQLKQRVALRCEVTPLDLRDTASYAIARVRIAGGSGPRVFTRQAIEEIFARSAGIPRIINVICDNVLLAGFARGERPVSSKLVAEVCSSLSLMASNRAENGTRASQPPTARAPQPTQVVDSVPTPSSPGRIFEIV